MARLPKQRCFTKWRRGEHTKDDTLMAQISAATSESLIWLSANTNPITFIHPLIIRHRLFFKSCCMGFDLIPADFGLNTGHTVVCSSIRGWFDYFAVCCVSAAWGYPRTLSSNIRPDFYRTTLSWSWTAFAIRNLTRCAVSNLLCEWLQS